MQQGPRCRLTAEPMQKIHSQNTAFTHLSPLAAPWCSPISPAARPSPWLLVLSLHSGVPNLPPPKLRTFLLPGVTQAPLNATWVGLASPPPAKGSGHKRASKPGQAMRRSWDIHHDLRALRAAWPAARSSLHHQLLAPSAGTHPRSGGAQGRRLLRLGIPTAASNMLYPGDRGHGPISPNFFTFLPRNTCLALPFPSSLHLPTPQHQAPVLATPPGPSPTTLPGAHTASGYRSLKSSPTETPPLGTLTSLYPSNAAPRPEMGTSLVPSCCKGMRTGC